MRVLPLTLLLLCSPAVAQTPPRVVSMTPADGGLVAPSATELVVLFDQDMDRSGRSICGGGPSFPKFTGRPKWDGYRKLVLPVKLLPDHEYELSLNCSSARNIRSRDGVRLSPTRWRFTTLPAKLRPFAEQQARNQAAWERAQALLQGSYAYRSRVVEDWTELLASVGRRCAAARTDRAFAVELQRLLAHAQDHHVVVHYGDRDYESWTPLIEPLYRTFAVRRLVELEKVSARVFRARTDDGIGYLLITGWQENVDAERLVGAIAEMMDARGLVIDVRPGTGGDERIARRVASWFVQGEKVYARHRRVTPDGLGPVEERRIRGNEAVYDRPVMVLAGPRVMGANESFVLMMKQAVDATVVGQKTLGSSGDPKVHDLGNGVRLTLPSWQALRPDGTCFEGQGLAPDVFVPCTSRDFETRDPTLDKALALLRERIKNGK
jgi:hypothetical protein